ncbi:HVO_A0114 family putative DNA-binding protein [Beijerinckia mobilis]|uniref:HVO_A0114 family putative DNA-binding protein n=1 Tax=Beijerinckia mobilis TaxID=231434 RepID=UPI0006906CE3|nr:helix-turn-helix domain-containing protein [Beijerinckia mobilis]
MNKTISAMAMRDRLLNHLKAPPKADDWVRVLGVPGHREVLGLIARHRPMSIGALAELAGRAQPNVSRTLSALAGAGLIEVVASGRRSIPQITEAGAERARELNLLKEEPDASARPAPEPATLFSMVFDEDADADSDVIAGQLTTWLWTSGSRERTAAQTTTDLNALGQRLLENWWRLLYRRDAPFRLWDFSLEEQAGAAYALLATVFGAQINLQARGGNGWALDLERGSKVFTIAAFEQLLLEEILHPISSRHWLSGRSARPLHALLRRVEDSRSQVAERLFCRTAGALGVSPYDLNDVRAAQIRDLIALIPDEDARLDFSSAVLAHALEEGQLWMRRELDRFHERNALPVLTRLRAECQSNLNPTVRPYRQGYSMAADTRALLKLTEDEPVGGVDGLSRLLGAGDRFGLSVKAPGSLRAFQSIDGEVPVIIVEDEGPRSSAFVLARGIGDFIAFGDRASCVADLYTDRQAVGRAFAAEFMAPRDAVVHMIEMEDQPVTVVADHFGVSPSVVHLQYANSFHG